MAEKFFIAGITGDKELDRKLLSLERKARRDLMKPGLRKGAKVFAAEVRARAPVRSGTMKARFKVRAQKRSRKDKDGIGYNVITGKGYYTGKAFYAGFVVFGHRLGKRLAGYRRKGTGKKPTLADMRPKIEPNPFMKDAFNAKAEEVSRVVAETIRDDVIKAVGGA